MLAYGWKHSEVLAWSDNALKTLDESLESYIKGEVMYDFKKFPRILSSWVYNFLLFTTLRCLMVATRYTF